MESINGITLTPPLPGSFIPAACYTSPAFYAQEMTHVFGTAWVMVGVTDQLAKSGDYLTATVGNEPIVVIRDDDGTLKGFYNVCTHRGAFVAQEGGGCAKRLTCTYHGWTFNLRGELIGMPERACRASGLNPTHYRLRSVRVSVWERFVFVCLSPDTESLSEWIGPLAERLRQFRLSELKAVDTFTNEMDVNWKVLGENLNDDYHVPIVHPKSIHRYIQWSQYRTEIRKHCYWTYTPLTAAGKKALPSRPDFDAEAREGAYWAGVFPNFLINAAPDGSISWQRVDPLGPTRVRLLTKLYDRGDLRARLLRTFMRRSTKIVIREDVRVFGGLWAGLQSRGFTPGPCMGERESRTWYFQVKLMEALSKPLPHAVMHRESGMAVVN